MNDFAVAAKAAPRGGRIRLWRGGLQGSEFAWAIAFLVPYVAVFLAFVVYPVAYGLWLGSEPALYAQLFPTRTTAHAWSTPRSSSASA